MLEPIENIARTIYEKLIDAGDISIIDDVLDPGLVYRAGSKVVQGSHHIADLVRAQRAAFEQFRLSVDRLLAQGDQVAVAWTISGVQHADFLGFAATGRRVEFSGITIHHFVDGRSVEALSYSNMADVLSS
jgi:predicted ester cyclase